MYVKSRDRAGCSSIEAYIVVLTAINEAGAIMRVPVRAWKMMTSRYSRPSRLGPESV